MPSNDVLEQEIKEVAELWFLQSLDLGDELAVDEQALLSSDWMHTNQGMHGVDRILAHQPTGETSMVDHLRRRVDGFELVNKLLEGRGEAPGRWSVSIDTRGGGGNEYHGNIGLTCRQHLWQQRQYRHRHQVPPEVQA